MAPIPRQTFEIDDPGLPVTPPGLIAPLMIGTCSGGVANEFYALSRVSDVIADLKQGPLAELASTYLSHPGAGGPVYVVPANPSIAGAVGSLTTVKPGSNTGTVTITGSPADAYHAAVEIMKTGPLGSAEYRYTLDGITWSPTLTVPGGGSKVIPDTGLTIAFVPGGTPANAFAKGDKYSAVCTAPYFDGTDLAAAITAAKAAAGGLQFGMLVAAGEAATPAAGALMAGALGGHAETMFNEHRFLRSLITAGGPTDDRAAAKTAYASFANKRANVVFGHNWQLTRKPMPGWLYPKRANVDLVTARAGALKVSTSLGRVASGPISEILKLEHDEQVNEEMDAARFTTLRSHPGERGFFITHGRLMSPEVSDYKYWHIGRLMDLCCATAYKAQMPMLGGSVRLLEDGSGKIDERDAVRLEEPVLDALDVALMQPNNAEGTKGHVTAVDYSIDRSTDVATSEGLDTTVSMIPHGYNYFIRTRLGFTLGGR